MDRDMSSHMDATMSTRQNGQLINATVAVSRPMRAGQMKELPAPGLSRNVTHPAYTSSDKRTAAKVLRDNTHPMFSNRNRKATGLSGLGLDIPGLGTISWAQLGVGLAAGVLLCKVAGAIRKKK